MKKLFFLILLLISIETFAIEETSIISQPTWEIAPNPLLSQHILGKRVKKYHVGIEFFTDEQGNVKVANLTKSSGNSALDSRVKQAVLRAKMKPFYKGGKTIPGKGVQYFDVDNKYAEEGSFYQCWLDLESAHYEKQKRYKTSDEALKELNFIYSQPPSISKKYESKNVLNQKLGLYNVKIYSKDGYIYDVTSPKSKDFYAVYAIDAIEGKKLQSRKSKLLAKHYEEFADTITFFRKCDPKPLGDD